MISELLKFADYQVAVSLLGVAVAWRWGDWKNWGKYYSTILYYIVNDLVVSLIFYNFPLWQLESPLLKTTFSDLVITLVLFPAVILTYIPHFPKSWTKRIFYILAWALALTIMEVVSGALGFITYHNGWNIWWTALFDVHMFVFIILHYKKPLFAWLLSLSYIAIAVFFFQLPYSLIK